MAAKSVNWFKLVSVALPHLRSIVTDIKAAKAADSDEGVKVSREELEAIITDHALGLAEDIVVVILD